MPPTRTTTRHQTSPIANSNSKRRGTTSADSVVELAPRRNKQKPQPEDIIEISSDSEDDLSEADRIRNLQRQLKKAKSDRAKLESDLRQTKRKLEATESALKFSEATKVQTGSVPISKLDDNLCCEICTLKMWTPYILPDCGHTFCESCLHDWFSTALQQHLARDPTYRADRPIAMPHFVRDMVGYGQFVPKNLINLLKQLDIGGPAYTCPTCRHAVTIPPTECFVLKNLTRAVAEAEGESSPKTPTAKSTGRGKNKAPAPTLAPFAKFFS